MKLSKEDLELINNMHGFPITPEKEEELVKYLKESLTIEEKEHIKNLFKIKFKSGHMNLIYKFICGLKEQIISGIKIKNY